MTNETVLDPFAGQERYVMIVDFNHVVHRFYNAMGKLGLSTEVVIDGELRRINTGVAKGVLQYLVKLSRGGTCPMVIVADRPVRSRKAYFSKHINSGSLTAKNGTYKVDRPPINSAMRDSADMIITILRKTGALVLAKDNYEADDIMPEVIRVAKEQYPTLPIHILCNDLDLTPLIDEQVSVYRNPAKIASSEKGYVEINKYQQITIRNYEESLEAMPAFKGLNIPYNSVLLSKLIRGDKSDNVSALDGWTPTRYRNLVAQMLEDGVDISIFRYHPWITQYYRVSDNEYFDTMPTAVAQKEYQDMKASNTLPLKADGRSFVTFPEYFTSNYRRKISDPVEKPKMVEILNAYVAEGIEDIKEIRKLEKETGKTYLRQSDVDEIMVRYDGMNLNGAFLDVDSDARRAPYVLELKTQIPSLNCGGIEAEGAKFQMNIRTF